MFFSWFTQLSSSLVYFSQKMFKKIFLCYLIALKICPLCFHSVTIYCNFWQHWFFTRYGLGPPDTLVSWIRPVLQWFLIVGRHCYAMLHWYCSVFCQVQIYCALWLKLSQGFNQPGFIKPGDHRLGVIQPVFSQLSTFLKVSCHPLLNRC